VKRSKQLLIGAALIAASAGSLAAQEVLSTVAIPVTAKLTGFFQYDTPLISEPGISSDSLYGLRSVRTDLQGKVNGNIGYRIHVEYAGGTLKLLDGHADVPLVAGWTGRFGKYKAPIGIELLQAPTDITFIDFGYTTYFVANRDTGVMVYGKAFGVDTQIAVLDGAPDYNGGSLDKDPDGFRALDVRVIGKPLANDIKGLDIGLGASVETRRGSTSSTQLGSYKTGGRTALYTYSSSAYADGNFYRLAPQFTYYAGPFGVLGEYVVNGQDVRLAGNYGVLVNSVWQLQAQYYLTGEDAGYKYVSPKVNYNPEKGQWGAWQLAARVQQTQIDGNAFSFGTGYKSSVSATAGLNWIWSENTKWFLNAENVWNTTVAGATASNVCVDLRLQVKY